MSSINVFGLPILQDANHTITRVDNDTYIIRPTMNTTGMTELKVNADSLLRKQTEVSKVLFVIFRLVFYSPLASKVITLQPTLYGGNYRAFKK